MIPGRLSPLVEGLRATGRRPLVPFLTAGYPDEATFLKIMGAAAEAGCRLVEIGFPFSDPVADGPVIQTSSQRVLKQGMTLRKTLALARRTREEFGLGVVLMGYLNPVLKMGPANFAQACAGAKVAGVIIPDLPPEESLGLRSLLREAGTELVDLIAPTTNPERLAANLPLARGFLYLVSTTAVTGEKMAGCDHLAPYVARVRCQTEIPLYVGFGISTPAQASAVSAIADGAIVGSALIRAIDAAPEHPADAAADYLKSMVSAMNRGLDQ